VLAWSANRDLSDHETIQANKHGSSEETEQRINIQIYISGPLPDISHTPVIALALLIVTFRIKDWEEIPAG